MLTILGFSEDVKKFIQNKKVIKDKLLPTPFLFDLIQEQSGTEWREMYQVFNMGHRLEVYAAPEAAEAMVAIGESFGIKTQVIGRVEDAEGESVEIKSPYGDFVY